MHTLKAGLNRLVGEAGLAPNLAGRSGRHAREDCRPRRLASPGEARSPRSANQNPRAPARID